MDYQENLQELDKSLKFYMKERNELRFWAMFLLGVILRYLAIINDMCTIPGFKTLSGQMANQNPQLAAKIHGELSRINIKLKDSWKHKDKERASNDHTTNKKALALKFKDFGLDLDQFLWS